MKTALNQRWYIWIWPTNYSWNLRTQLGMIESIWATRRKRSLETRHTLVENSVLKIPIRERKINTYKTQIDIRTGDFTQVKCEKIHFYSKIKATISKIYIREDIWERFCYPFIKIRNWQMFLQVYPRNNALKLTHVMFERDETFRKTVFVLKWRTEFLFKHAIS